MKLHFLIIGTLIIAVLGCGCSDQSGTATPSPTATPSQAKFSAGDILAKTATSTDTFWMIIKYDTKTGDYERALVFKKSGGSWYRKDNKTEHADRELMEKLYPAKVDHVNLTSSVSVITLTATVTTIKTPAPGSEPLISGIIPSNGTSGMSVSITDLSGERFQSGATVHLEGVDGSSLKASNVIVTDTKITCYFNLYGLKAGHYSVVVKNPDGGSDILTNGFTVNEPGPVVNSITPSEGMIGQTIDLTITGSNFKIPAKVIFTRGTSELEGANVVVNSQTQIVCVLRIPNGTATGPWSITVRNVQDKQNGTSLNPFTIKNAT